MLLTVLTYRNTMTVQTVRNRRKVWFVGVVLLLLAFVHMASAVQAQSLHDTIIELREVQVRADRFFQKETAGMKQTRVDTLVLRQKLHLSLSELLSENTPVYIKSHGRGALATASFRGTAPSHTQVNWNGININSPMLGMVDFSLIPVYIIDDITLKHGSASVSDQSGGLGGSINLINQADWSNQRQLAYMQGVGSYSTWDQFLLLSLGNRKVQWRSRMYYNRSENDYTFVNRTIASMENGQREHPVDTNKNAAFTRYGALQELYWQPASDQVLSVQWWGQWARRGIPRVISYEGAENANISQQSDQDQKLVARWQWYGEKENVTLRSGFAARNLDYTLTQPVSGQDPVAAVFSQSNQRSFLQYASYSRQLGQRWAVEGTLNVDHHRVHTRDTVTRTGYETSREDASMLIALQNQPVPRLNLNLMLRQELVGGVLSPLIPFLGFDYLASEEIPWVLKASIARNFRHPSLNDLYWLPGGNPDLQPEQGITFEVGTQNQLLMGKTHFRTEFTLFRSDIKDWIVWVPSFKGYWEPQNIRRVLSQGLEAHGQLWGEAGDFQYRLLASYSLTRALNYGDPLVWGDQSYGKQLVFIPVHSGNLMVYMEYKGFSVAWQHNSYSERFTTSSNDPSRRNWLYPYFMNDLALGKQWQLGSWDMQAGLKIYNLFDETYHTVLYRPMPGRNFLLTLKTQLR